MARATTIIVALVLVGLSMTTAPTEATRVPQDFQETPYFEGSLVASALPKGTTSPSTPSNKGHEVLADMRKLFVTVYRPANQVRVLRSVPSPGVGH